MFRLYIVNSCYCLFFFHLTIRMNFRWIKNWRFAYYVRVSSYHSFYFSLFTLSIALSKSTPLSAASNIVNISSKFKSNPSSSSLFSAGDDRSATVYGWGVVPTIGRMLVLALGTITVKPTTACSRNTNETIVTRIDFMISKLTAMNKCVKKYRRPTTDGSYGIYRVLQRSDRNVRTSPHTWLLQPVSACVIDELWILQRFRWNAKEDLHPYRRTSRHEWIPVSPPQPQRIDSFCTGRRTIALMIGHSDKIIALFCLVWVLLVR